MKTILSLFFGLFILVHSQFDSLDSIEKEDEFNLNETKNSSFEGNFINEEFEKTFKEHSVCQCNDTKIWSNGECFDNLIKAINAASDESVIYISSDIDVHSPIIIEKDLSFYGVQCSNTSDSKPKLINKINAIDNFEMSPEDSHDAIFELSAAEFRTLRFRNIEFTRKSPDGLNLIGRFIKAVSLNKEIWLSLDIRNCHFHNFLTRRLGSVILMNYAHRISIDQDSIFENNHVEGNCDCYEGGAIAAEYISENSFIETNASFINNSARFLYDWSNSRNGSEHAQGGAIYVKYIDGSLIVRGNIQNNSGNDGGAISIRTVDNGNIWLNGNFNNNFVVDGGAESRGGVIRVFNLSGTLTLNGIYTNNSAFSNLTYNARGGVFAGNYINSKARVIVNATFLDNQAVRGGSVLSVFRNHRKNEFGQIIIEKESKFYRNEELSNSDNVAIFVNAIKSLKEKDLNRDEKIILNKN